MGETLGCEANDMSKKIIVVDDSSVLRKELFLVLSSAGYEVVEATNGLHGLQRLDENPDALMVLSDINMPEMSGIEMLTRIKTNPKYASLPVVMVTTEGNTEIMKQAKRAGAKGWIVKPFNNSLVLEAVKMFAGGA
jgi:two-component system chemotaxis response regulator CheY